MHLELSSENNQQ
uniref:Uncharacterized protein n=1 Tax=Anguilla anguilla TaxID=7936 RepID=A0A0E9T6M5_ANGAN